MMIGLIVKGELGKRVTMMANSLFQSIFLSQYVQEGKNLIRITYDITPGTTQIQSKLLTAQLLQCDTLRLF